MNEELLLYELKNKTKLAIQDIVMYALSKTGFFHNAALHGEKARRIHYKIDGFSGHLEFSLIKPNSNFRIETILPAIQKELASCGLNISSEIKEKSGNPNIKSIVLKGSTKELFLQLFNDSDMSDKIPDPDMTDLRFELNITPPLYANICHEKYQSPAPFEISMYDKPSLFAEKINNTIVRAWKSRTRGCDLYDYDFYLANNVPANFRHLVARLLDSKYVEAKEDMTLDEVKTNLCNRFREINYEQTKIDLLPFITDPESLKIWSAEYFCGITQNLTAE